MKRFHQSVDYVLTYLQTWMYLCKRRWLRSRESATKRRKSLLLHSNSCNVSGKDRKLMTLSLSLMNNPLHLSQQKVTNVPIVGPKHDQVVAFATIVVIVS